MKILRYFLSAFLAMSISGIIYAQEPQPFKRDLEQVSFVPKGQWITGLSASYSQSSSNNYQFFVIEDIKSDSYSLKASPMVMYAFHDDLAAGARFTYSRQMTKVQSGALNISPELGFNVDNLYSISHNYYGTAVFRNYISMGKSKRFGFFNDVQLEIGGGQSKLCQGTGDALSGTYEKNFSIGVGLAPGVTMFLNNYTALEVNVGILGFNYTHTDATTDQIYYSERKSNYANFKLNLMSISFGVAFYL